MEAAWPSAPPHDQAGLITQTGLWSVPTLPSTATHIRLRSCVDSLLLINSDFLALREINE